MAKTKRSILEQYTGMGGAPQAVGGYNPNARGRSSGGGYSGASYTSPMEKRRQGQLARERKNDIIRANYAQSQARYYQGQAGVGNIPGGNQGGTHRGGNQGLASMYRQQAQSLGQNVLAKYGSGGGGGTDPWAAAQAKANAANQKRYNQIIGGYNSLIGATRERLNQRSNQAVTDAESHFKAQSTANRQDLVSRGLAASTVGSGMDAMYGRQKMASINDAKDSQIQQYYSQIAPLYQQMYGVVERKNDIAPDPALYANLQQGAGYALQGGGGYGGYQGNGYMIPNQAMGMMGGGGGGNWGGGFNQQQQAGDGGAARRAAAAQAARDKRENKIYARKQLNAANNAAFNAVTSGQNSNLLDRGYWG